LNDNPDSGILLTMRPKGTPEQLAARRARALQLLAEGHSPTAIARQIGVARQTIYEWKANAKRKPRPSKRRPGGVCRLSASQQKRLARELQRGAYAHGYPEDHWTLDRIGRVIYDLYGVRYHPSSVWHLLRRMGWSSQRPQRTGQERDDEAIADWKTNQWSRIKKVARAGRDPGAAG
jgi:transposase